MARIRSPQTGRFMNGDKTSLYYKPNFTLEQDTPNINWTSPNYAPIPYQGNNAIVPYQKPIDVFNTVKEMNTRHGVRLDWNAEDYSGMARGASNALATIGGYTQRANQPTGNIGNLCTQTPYIIIKRPNLSLPEDYGHYYGYPSNITSLIGNLEGFTVVSDVHLHNFNATAGELELIESQLKSGFIIANGTNALSYTGTETNIGIRLGHNSSDNNTLGKSVSLLTALEGTLKEATDIINPSLILTGIDSYISTLNYLYIPQFNRFYFVNNIVSLANNLWQIDCSVDVLETYKTSIKATTAVIARQEFKYNLYLDDGTLKAFSNPMIQTLKFDVNTSQGQKQSMSDTTPSYVLVVCGSQGS